MIKLSFWYYFPKGFDSETEHLFEVLLERNCFLIPDTPGVSYNAHKHLTIGMRPMTENAIDMEINLPRSDSAAKTPGILLREARQAKNLQQSDVAKEIRLSIQWVKDLEQDDYSHVPALIYVRGYLRGYARYVGISPDEVMAAFDEMGLEEEFERVKAEVERPVKHHAVPVVLRSKRMINGKMVRWVTVILLVALIVSVGVWWQGKKHILGQLQSVISSPQENLPLKQTSVNSVNTNKTINTNLTEQPTAIKYKNKITFSGTNH